MFANLFGIGLDSEASVMGGNNTGCSNSSSACNGVNRGCSNSGSSCDGSTNYKSDGTTCENLAS